MESNFKKLAKAVKDLEIISAMSEEDKLLLAGGYAEQLVKNVELMNELCELQEKKNRMVSGLWQ